MVLFTFFFDLYRHIRFGALSLSLKKKLTISHLYADVALPPQLYSGRFQAGLHANEAATLV